MATLTSAKRERRDHVFHAFLRWGHDEKGWSARTRQTYYYRVLAADVWLQEHRQTSVVWAGYEDLKRYLWSLNVSASTRNQIRNALIAFGGYLEGNGFVAANPAIGLARIPQARGIPKAFSREELGRVLAIAAAQPIRDRAVFHLFLYTGMRLTEVRTLKWQHLDLEDRWVRFWAKGAKERSIPIHDELLPILREWRRNCLGQDWVFPSPTKHGHPVSEQLVHRTMKRIGDAAGVHLYPHLMRHTCAMLLLESGVDIRDVKEWLGHVNLSTTSIYLQLWPANLRAAAKKLRVKARRSDDKVVALTGPVAPATSPEASQLAETAD